MKIKLIKKIAPRFTGCIALCLLGMVSSTAAELPSSTAATAVEDVQTEVLRFAIQNFAMDGATLLTASELNTVVLPYTGQNKDFSDVQKALEAIEALYLMRGYSAVHVLLPEQELTAGVVHFQIIEARYGNILAKDNQFFSEANVLNAVPSLRTGNPPQAQQLARELKLANENPARQLNVVLKGGAKEDLVDASVLVKDTKPGVWTVNLDNTGTPETGRARLGVAYQHANLLDKDQLGQIQMQISPEHVSRVKVVAGSYKIPLYQYGHSIEVFGAYSNVNSVVGGLANFQGGGAILGTRYNVPLERIGEFDSHVSFGAAWLNFSKVQLTNPPPITLYNPIVVTPLIVAYAMQGKVAQGDLFAHAAFALNLPLLGQGKSANFANYDQVNFTQPSAQHQVLRFVSTYSVPVHKTWMARAALTGQATTNQLIQGEQIRLGGVDGVRGFAEGSEGGENGMKLNLEAFAPLFEQDKFNLRGLIFFDWGTAKSKANSATAISALGFGLRSTFSEQYSVRLDAGRIVKAGNDPQQKVGNWRLHASMVATF
ncbi:MAG: ShlB/FhaC/HecB family hemolysin secretion/activation protein [Sideroxydans sp.]